MIVCFAIAIGYAACSDSSRNSEIEVTQDPARLAYLLLDFRDASYKSSATEAGDGITVKFNLGKYSVTSEVAFLDQVKYVSGKFNNNFKEQKPDHRRPKPRSSTSKATSLSGRPFKSSSPRPQASSINWSNVQYFDLPQLAQEYWKVPE